MKITLFAQIFQKFNKKSFDKLVDKNQSNKHCKSNLVEVTCYLDRGLFETSYVKPRGGGIDSNRFYNTLHIKDGTSLIATLRVGANQPDATPAVKYNIGDENWSGYSFFCGQSQSGYFRIINHIQCRGYSSVLKF